MTGLRGQQVTLYLDGGNKWSTTAGYLRTYRFNIFDTNLDDHLILFRAGLPCRGDAEGPHHPGGMG